MNRHVVVLFGGLLVGLSLGACHVASPWLGGLQLEEHRLAAPPDLDSGAFQPGEASQEEILSRHADKRAATFHSQVDFVDGNPVITSLGEPANLTARLVASPDDPMRSIARLYRGDEEIFAADAGLPSPALPLQSLWSYDGHWALELLYSDAETWAGRVFVDGEMLNAVRGYDEAFGFQLLAGRPFYFFRREGSVGFSYDGGEADLGYDDVVHYRCCAESVLNPVQAEEMVGFFAAREGTWYYVELGRFDL